MKISTPRTPTPGTSSAALDRRRRRGGTISLVVLAALVLLALFGPLIAPHPIDRPIGANGQLPGPGMLLGTDYLGRDVLSRPLSGGLTAVGIATGGTIGLYLLAIPLAVAASYLGRGWDTAVMRIMDLLLCIPGMLLALLLVNGLGGSIGTLLLCVVLAQLPAATRVIRAAALEVCARPFVEVGYARGDSAWSIAWHDILPNIVTVVVSDAGLRFRSAVILVTAVNFLGLGLAPPAADWGLMISENLGILPLNPWAALAPAGLLVALTITVNAVADRYTSAALERTSGAQPR